MKTLYVGNLPQNSNINDLRKFFASQGQVHSVTLIVDRNTGKQRGFGFIDMDDLAAKHAIETLNLKKFGGRALMVNDAGGQKWHPPTRPRYKTD